MKGNSKCVRCWTVVVKSTKPVGIISRKIPEFLFVAPKHDTWDQSHLKTRTLPRWTATSSTTVAPTSTGRYGGIFALISPGTHSAAAAAFDSFCMRHRHRHVSRSVEMAWRTSDFPYDIISFLPDIVIGYEQKEYNLHIASRFHSLRYQQKQP